MDENRAGRGTKRNGNKRLASESNPVEQGQDFATSTRTLDREKMSDLSDITTENVATTRSPTGNTMMHGVTENTNRETGTTDRFGVVRTMSKSANGTNQSGDVRTGMNWEVQPGSINRRSLDEHSDSIGEQNEQMSLRMSELERAVHVERESLRKEINRNRQEVSRSEKRWKEKTDGYMAKNLSRRTREAEQRETRFKDDMEKLRIQQEQTLGTFETRMDAMMERRTETIMDRLDGLRGNRSGSRNGEANSG